MAFSHTMMVGAIDAGASSADPCERAVAHNFRWDERIGDARRAGYEQASFLPPSATFSGLIKGYSDYFKLRIEWDGTSKSFAETFQPLNNGAILAALPDERRRLVRMVKIDRTLQDIPLTFTEFANAANLVRSGGGSSATSLTSAQAVIDKFVAAWNNFDRRPPCFVGFAEDVHDELADQDWPHLLRDRFGLKHCHVAPGAKPIRVMLLEYTVKDVLRAAKRFAIPGNQVFRVPTVLESSLYHFFYPSPTPLPYGRTVYLAGGVDPKKLTCELVHLPVNLRSKYISKVGSITRPIPIPASQLAGVRNDHLEILRSDSGRNGFGEMM